MSEQTPASTTTREGSFAWEQLAQDSRELSDLAERIDSLVREYAASPEALRSSLQEVDQAVRGVQRAAGECRRSTYRALEAGGMERKGIAAVFGVTVQAVHKVLGSRKPRPRRVERKR